MGWFLFQVVKNPFKGNFPKSTFARPGGGKIFPLFFQPNAFLLASSKAASGTARGRLNGWSSSVHRSSACGHYLSVFAKSISETLLSEFSSKIQNTPKRSKGRLQWFWSVLRNDRPLKRSGKRSSSTVGSAPITSISGSNDALAGSSRLIIPPPPTWESWWSPSHLVFAGIQSASCLPFDSIHKRHKEEKMPPCASLLLQVVVFPCFKIRFTLDVSPPYPLTAFFVISGQRLRALRYRWIPATVAASGKCSCMMRYYGLRTPFFSSVSSVKVSLTSMAAPRAFESTDFWNIFTFENKTPGGRFPSMWSRLRLEFYE